MQKCKECCFFKAKDNIRGICVKSRSGVSTKRKNQEACKRFIEGEWEEDIKLKVICNNLAAGYKGGRWG